MTSTNVDIFGGAHAEMVRRNVRDVRGKILKRKMFIKSDTVPDIIICQVILSEGDVCGHHTPHHTGHRQVLMKYDAGGHNQPSVREETRVVNVKYFTWRPSVSIKL